MLAKLVNEHDETLGTKEVTPQQLQALNQRAGDVAELEWKPVRMSMYELGQLMALLLCVPGSFGGNENE